MENTSNQEPVEQPRRLTRIEQARLEALQSFGCEDFGSVLKTAKRVSLTTKLRPRSKRLGAPQANAKPSKRQHHQTQAELGVLEALKSFENNSLTDISNSSKRIVSKFLNKPAKSLRKENTMTKDSNISCGQENICGNNAAQDLPDKTFVAESSSDVHKTSKTMAKLLSQRNCAQSYQHDRPKRLQTLLQKNKIVLQTARELDTLRESCD